MSAPIAALDIDPAIPTAAALNVRPIAVLRCGIALLNVRLSLRTAGFGPTMRWMRRRVSGVDAAPPPNDVGRVIMAVERTVAMAGAFFPGRARCLEQSLVLYDMLRRRGIDVRYRQGLQARPLAAHAWVEYLGRPINDVPEHVRQFVPLPDQLP